MAVEALFNADRDTLLKRARIESADDEQTIALIDQTITEVRLGFYSSLGDTRVDQIAAYSLVDNPSTSEERLRAEGATTEANWLTWLLAQRLPHLFMDNRASTGDLFNDEQLTRDTSASKAFLDNLKAQIDKGLGALASPVNEDTGSVKASSIGPDDDYKPFEQFAGLYPRGRNLAMEVF